MKRIIFPMVTILVFFTLSAQDKKITTGSERLKDWRVHRKMVDESPFKRLPWVQVGPVLNSGRIAAIVGIPDNNNIIYASATVGGVWKTVNAGTTWEPIFEDAPTQTIGDIEVCPTDPDLVWVGTGSSNLSGSAYPGLGVFKSQDGGDTWEHKGLSESQHVMRIAIDPNDPETVFVATMGSKYYPKEKAIGLHKTVNGGRTWTKVLSDDRYTGCADVVFHPRKSDILFASTWNKRKTEGFVYRTTDGGLSWQKLTSGLPDGKKIGRIGVDVSLSNPDVVYVYLNNHNTAPQPAPVKTATARKTGRKLSLSLNRIKRMSVAKFLAIDSGQLTALLRKHGMQRSFSAEDIKEMVRSGLHTPKSLYNCINKFWPESSPGRNRNQRIGGEVYRSVDGGINWRKSHDKPLYLLSTFGWSFCDIKISPENENELYILGVTLQYSNDGGRTFQPNEGRLVHLVPNISTFLHLDQHDIWIDPKNADRILLGNDGGTFISHDKGINWLHHNTIPIGMFYKISVDLQEPYNIYGGTQDDSSVYGPSDQNLAYQGAERWKYVWLDRWSGGDGLFIMPDINDPNTVYYESQNGALRRKNLAENKNVFIQPKRGLCETALRTDWSTPFYVSSTEKDTIYYGANRLFKSSDRGDNWTGISPDLTKEAEKGKNRNDRLTAFAVDSLDPQIIVAGSRAGLIHLTRDGGLTWSRISDGLPAERVNSVKLSRHNRGTIYIVLTGNNADRNPYLYKSTDHGESWSSINGNLPLEKTECIAEDTDRPDLLYLGTELGVYVSLNAGSEWFSLSAGLPTVSVDDLLVHPRESDLVIGTYGRGIYRLDISPIRQLKTDITNKSVHLFSFGEFKLPKRRDFDGDWFFETATYPSFVFYLKEAGRVKAEILEKSGKIVKTFNLDGIRGMNRFEWDLVQEKAQYRRSAYKSGTRLYRAGDYRIKITTDSGSAEKDFKLKEYRVVKRSDGKTG